MITKRALIETRIIAHARVLEAAYIAASNEMIVIIQGRDKDLDVPVSGAALSA